MTSFINVIFNCHSQRGVWLCFIT